VPVIVKSFHLLSLRVIVDWYIPNSSGIFHYRMIILMKNVIYYLKLTKLGSDCIAI